MTSSVPSLPPYPLPRPRLHASAVAGLDAILRDHHDVIAVFHATWCAFCRAFLAETAEAKFSAPVVLVDVSDTESPLWDRYDVQVVPTVVRFERGREVARIEAPRGEGLLAADLLLLADDGAGQDGTRTRHFGSRGR